VRELAASGEVRDPSANERASEDPRAFQEVRKSRETLLIMNDTDLAVARIFHSRLIDLLRVECSAISTRG
jgi:hypothetical protein